MNIITGAIVLALLFIVFHLGGTWSVYNIRKDLQRDGTSIAHYGDTNKVKITGTAEDI